MAVTIVPAALRDVSYVLYNLNDNDEEEIACQIDPALKRSELAYALLMSGDNFAVRENDRPIAVFGTAPINRATLSVWAVGTKRMPKALAPIGRYLIDTHLPEMIAKGYRYMEARSIVTHTPAHRWLEFWGAEQHGGPFEFGTARELFLLFRWTDTQIESIRQKRRRAS